MISRILEYVRRFQLGTHLSDVYEPVFADLIPVAAELDFPHFVCMETIIFHGAGSTPMLLLGKIVYDKIQLFVPIRFYRQCSTDLILAMFELPNSGQKMPLYNAEKIEANPHCTVILSDEMAIAFCNDSDEKMVFSTWYGGMELVEKIDWELLRGHKVQWLVFDENNDAEPAENIGRRQRWRNCVPPTKLISNSKYLIRWNGLNRVQALHMNNGANVSLQKEYCL